MEQANPPKIIELTDALQRNGNTLKHRLTDDRFL